MKYVTEERARNPLSPRLASGISVCFERGSRIHDEGAYEVCD